MSYSLRKDDKDRGKISIAELACTMPCSSEGMPRSSSILASNIDCIGYRLWDELTYSISISHHTVEIAILLRQRYLILSDLSVLTIQLLSVSPDTTFSPILNPCSSHLCHLWGSHHATTPGKLSSHLEPDAALEVPALPYVTLGQ